jgi:tetratricopeptide (TPR) repeat protein
MTAPKEAVTPVANQPKPEPKSDANATAYNQYIAAARQSFAQKNYDTASKYATEALKYKPGDPEASKIINDSHVAMTAPKEVPKVEAPRSDSSAQLASLLQTAAAYEGQSKYTEANNTYRDALKVAPTNADVKKKVDFTALMASGQRDLSAGRFPNAASEFDQALKLYPNDANAKHYAQLAKDKKKQ